MTNREKANIILENLDDVIQVDWNNKDIYLKAIEKALETFEEA